MGNLPIQNPGSSPKKGINNPDHSYYSFFSDWFFEPSIDSSIGRDLDPYLEDGLPGLGSVANNHGDRFRPQDMGLWDPFQMAEIYGL